VAVGRRRRAGSATWAPVGSDVGLSSAVGGPWPWLPFKPGWESTAGVESYECKLSTDILRAVVAEFGKGLFFVVPRY